MSTSKLEYSRGDVIAGKFEVVDLLDESPLGLTYRAKHLKSGKYIRITMLRPDIAGPEQKDQIVAAFKHARELQHKHLVKVGELGEHDGTAFYTMEDFEGTTLRELLQEYKVEGKQFAVKEAAQITIQVLEALHASHVDTLVMRALRPEYVLVNVRYTGPRRQNFVAQVKLVGTAFWDLVPIAVLAEDEFTRGEAQYLAPEMKSFEPTPTGKSDIYSAGVMLYEMLVGQAPVGTFQLPSARRPDLSQHVNDVVELALARAPEDRYQTAQDFITDIQRIFQDADEAIVEKKPIITMVGWGLALALVILIAVILFNIRTDPVKVAQAADSQLRAGVSEQHAKPTADEVTAMTKQHPKGMVYIPAGPFVSGRLHTEESKIVSSAEKTAEVVEVDSFLIDAFEYPNIQGEAPKYGLSSTEAAALCAEAGKRLCSADEWEKACKGRRNTVYSYGDTFDADFCGNGLDDVYKSGAKAQCKSDWNVFDMSGNFREWTSSTPRGKDNRRIVKGGMKGNSVKGTRCGLISDEAFMSKDNSLSFRCCRDADAAPVTEE